MKMHSEEGPEAGKASENGEPMDVSVQEEPDSSNRHKYRELKSKLKYLIYEHNCFEAEMYRAQSKLIELSRDKMVLLDQLLQYEPVSDEEEEVTDYSTSEDETIDSRTCRPAPSKQQLIEGRASVSQKSSGTPSAVHSPSGATQLAPKSGTLATKQGSAKVTPISTNPASHSVSLKVSNKAVKRQAKQAAKPNNNVKILKTISRVRQTTAPDTDTVPPDPTLNSIAKQKLVVSYPITSITTTDIPPPLPPTSASTVITTTLTIASTPQLIPTITTVPANRSLNRPIPMLTKTQPSSSSSSSLLPISSTGAIHISTISTANIPPLISVNSKGGGRNSSSSSFSSGSSSSSGSDSGESGSDSSSSSDDEEAMDTEAVGGPVQMVSTVKTSSDLPRPKAILSPVKITLPSSLMRGNAHTPPPIISPMLSPRQTQAAFATWTQSPVTPNAEMGSPLSAAPAAEPGGFIPLAPPLSSPSSSLPFSSLSKPGASGSAFQVFSPKAVTPSTPLTPVSSPHTSTATNTPTSSSTAIGTLSNSVNM